MSDSLITLSSIDSFSYHWNKSIDNKDFYCVRLVKSVVGFFQGWFGGYSVSVAEIISVMNFGKHSESIFAKGEKLKDLNAKIVNDLESKGVSVDDPSLDELEQLMERIDFNSSDQRFSERELLWLEAGDSLRLFNSALAQGDWECREIAHRLLSITRCDQKFGSLSGIAKANALSFFADCGLYDQLKNLLSYGKDEINDQDSYGCCTPLIAAARAGRVDCVRLLLNNEANASEPNAFGCTPLHYAAKGGHEASIKLLLDAGANVYEVDLDDIPPLFLHYLFDVSQ